MEARNRWRACRIDSGVELFIATVDETLVPKTQIQGEIILDLPIVLREQVPILGGFGPIGRPYGRGEKFGIPEVIYRLLRAVEKLILAECECSQWKRGFILVRPVIVAAADF